MSKKKKKKGIGTKSQVQELHDEIASVLLAQIREQRKEAESSEDSEDTLSMCVDPKTIDNAIKLLRLNKTVAREDEESRQEQSQVSELELIKEQQRGRVARTMKR
ncbi:hypothetical protein [Vibrio owensii]|uniref:hypothetical protein n=1 Tax=Vibrio owensii TaxID=696485 RepID=UPI003AAEF667